MDPERFALNVIAAHAMTVHLDKHSTPTPSDRAQTNNRRELCRAILAARSMHLPNSSIRQAIRKGPSLARYYSDPSHFTGDDFAILHDIDAHA